MQEIVYNKTKPKKKKKAGRIDVFFFKRWSSFLLVVVSWVCEVGSDGGILIFLNPDIAQIENTPTGNTRDVRLLCSLKNLVQSVLQDHCSCF